MRPLTAFVLASLVSGAWAEDEPLRWRTDLNAARKEAVEAGKPMLVTFRCVP